MKNHKIFIITGLSGSGKSTAMAAFEDAGFYCVDNMPAELLPKLLELPMKNDPGINGLAFVMDMRARNFLSEFSSIHDRLNEKGYKAEIIFLEADVDTLIKRYSQTRRHHPVSNAKSLMESIKDEMQMMGAIRNISNIIIDTSEYNVHRLKSEIISIAGKKSKIIPTMKIHILSFGYKYGIPHDADLVVDMRFLLNPYFNPELKDQDGESSDVRSFVLKIEQAKIFLKKYLSLLDFLIPLYKKEGKAYLTIAVGCTGGRHRSVVIARKLFEELNMKGYKPEIIHRDIDRDTKKI